MTRQFTIPNEGDAAFADQSGVFQADIDVIAGAGSLTGVYSGCGVTADGTTMVLTVANGVILIDGVVTSCPGGMVTCVSDGTSPRFALIEADGSGVYITHGTPHPPGSPTSAGPVLPSGTAGRAILSSAYIEAADTAITSNQLTNKSLALKVVPIGLGGTGATTAAGARTNLSVYSKAEVDTALAGAGQVISVNTKTGAVTLTYSDVGADAAGAASSAVSAHVGATDPHGDRAYTNGLYTTESAARAAADALLIPLSQKGAPSGVVPLDSSSLIPAMYLPAIALTNTSVVADQTAMLALTAQPGDVAIRTDIHETFILAASPASTLANWIQFDHPTSPVSSVNGRTGSVSGLAEATALADLSGVTDAATARVNIGLSTAGGDLTGTYPNPTLVTTGVTNGSYGAADKTITLTVDTKGRLTAAAAVAIAIAESQVTNLVADLAAKAPVASPTFTGTATAPAIIASGLTGSVAASRYVGATTTGAPTTGAHAVGDFVIAQDGKVWICTTAGTPGAWTSAGTNPTAGTGITITGATVAIDTSVTVDKTTAQTLTNKTLTAPVLNSPTGLAAADIPALPASKITGTAVTQADTGTVTNAMLAGSIAESKVTNLVSDLAAKAPTASPTFTGTVTLPNTGSGALEAATKAYVDATAQGLSVKGSVACATTANITLSGEQTIDGVTTSASRVLVKNQSTASQNGIYVSASGAWTRAVDMDANSEVAGAFVFVEGGTANSATGWVVAAAGPFTIGTTSITWTQFSGAGTYTAGSGLNLTGSQFSIPSSGVTNAMLAGSIDPAKVTGTAVVTSDSRLSDTRTPTDGTVTDAKIATTLSPSKITGTAATGGGTATGTNTGDQTITLTGDVTGSGTGSFAATIASGAVTSAKIADGTIMDVDVNASAGIAPSKVAGTALVSAAIGTTVQPYDSALTTLALAFSSVNVPRRALDRWRGGAVRVDTTLTTAITSNSTTNIVVGNVNLTRVGVYDTIMIDSEEMLVIRGQGTTNLVVVRGVNGTAIANHSAGAAVMVDRVNSCAVVGDSTVQGDSTSVTGVWDSWVNRARRIANDRFGGSLGRGFFGLWKSDFAESGVWSTTSTTAVYWTGPFYTRFGSVATAVNTWTRPPDVRVAAIDVLWVDWSSGQALGPGLWSYSIDGGTTWIDNPGPPGTKPTNTTTLGSADNGRRCDYFDGTKTMTLTSTAGYEQSGFVQVECGDATTRKCSAVFTYDGVSGSTLTNVMYIGNAAFNSVTMGTGDTVQARAEIKRTRIVTSNPASLKFRCGTASGTNKTCMFVGLDVWSTVPTFGVTRGVKLHNIGKNGQLIANLINSRSFPDAGTSTSSGVLTSNIAAFVSTDVGCLVSGPNIPAGTYIQSYQSSTQVTMSANALATVAQGSAVNTVTIQGTAGGWDRLFDGCAASLRPNLMLQGGWTNDVAGWVYLASLLNGGRTATGNTSTSGTGKTVTLTSGTFQQSDVGAIIQSTTGSGIALTAKIASVTDSTHAEMDTAASSTQTGLTIVIQTTSGHIAQCIQNKMDTLYAASSAYADQMLIIAFEQGGPRLQLSAPSQSDAAGQSAYRSAQQSWAATNYVATLNIYQAWAVLGYAGFSSASAAGYMDTADTSGFHEGPNGYADMASRVTRMWEAF